MNKKYILGLILAPVLILSNSTSADNSDFNYLPSNSGQIVSHKHYTLSYIEEHEQAEWVAYLLTQDELKGTTKRKDSFKIDPKVKTGSAHPSDYKKSGYDKGHLAPAADMRMDIESMSDSFYMSNMSPQHPRLNRGIWKKSEELTRDWVRKHGDMYIVSGPIFSDDMKKIGENQVSIPNSYYKIILDMNKKRAIAFVFQNKKNEGDIFTYSCTIDEVEKKTSIDFFQELSDDIEDKIESKCSPYKW
jgi:endonuclease G